jgi:hypothetical protein
MRVTQHITELCLVSEAGTFPFAVLIEQGDRCAVATAADFGARIHEQWAGHVLEAKECRPQEWWVLAAWRDCLSEIAQEAPEQRRLALEQLERSTPGIAIRRPKSAFTRLPVDALAMRWRRHRLHERSEVIGGDIAARLERHGVAYCSAELEINERYSVVGDWVVTTKSAYQNIWPAGEWLPERITGATVIRVVDASEVEEIRGEWAYLKEELGADHPFGIAIVRQSHQAELTDAGCIVGDCFSAPVSFAVAAAQAHRRRDLR